MRGSWLFMLGACGGPNTPPATQPQRVVAVDAGVATAVPRAPGIYPLLAVLDLIDPAPDAYILACAKVEAGKPTTLLDAGTCAPLLGNVPLEMIGEDEPTPVRAGVAGKADTCPWVTPNVQPFIRITGLPEDRSHPGFVVGHGVVESTGVTAPATIAAIAAKHPPIRSKRPVSAPPPPPTSLDVRLQLDLDGDGTIEIVTLDPELVRLFGADGELIGSVGCAE